MRKSEALRYRQRIETAVQSLPDGEALEVATLYPKWSDLLGTTVDKAGVRFTYGGKLYKTIPANHTFQAEWVPGVGTEALYTRIDEEHAETLDDPIPYNGNMALESGKYYLQGSVTYLCTRDTGIAVYQPLADLVGVYVEEVTA